ncbi:MAG: dihydrofolate reductase [Christensenellales bacterium]
MNLIFCVDKNFGIGINNKMLFNLKQDLTYFKQKTINKVVVMGHGTLLSLPNGKPLKNRTNIVLTSKDIKIENATVVHNLNELLMTLKSFNSDDIFIIGGESVYTLMLPYCKTAYCTKVDSTQKATVFAPNLDNLPNWKKVSESENFVENNLNFKFVEYANIKPLSF